MTNIKRLLCIGLILLLAFSLPMLSASALQAKPILKKGMSGDEVLKLQKDLKQLGFFNLNPTGFFGDSTEASVIKFQKKYKLDPDGKVGAGTYKKIDSLLNRANPVKIVIDPGHGGVDTGTLRDNVIESEVTLAISKKLKVLLEEKNFSATLTRTTSTSLEKFSTQGNSNVEKDLNGRTNIINQSGAKLFVSIHVNSLPGSPSTSGSIVYYNDKIPQSKTLAQNIQKALNNIIVSNFKRQSHSSRSANFYVLRNSKVPGVLVETAFITNNTEKGLLMNDNFRNQIAKAIMTGVENTKLK